MMPKMMQEMGEMWRTMDSQAMRAMMETMMPSMMEQCHAKLSGEELISMMHDMMPKMMDGCFAKMDPQQRQGMLGMCREMLDNMEAKYLTTKA